MKKLNSNAGMNRRNFIKTAGLAAGVLATYPLQAHAGIFFSTGPAITIGVLSPSSSIFPDMGKNFIEGMKLQFTEAGWSNIKLIVEESGTSPRLALKKAEKLITEDRIDLLVGFLNPLIQPQLIEILKKTSTPFINVEGGANVPTANAENILINHNTCGYWQANLAMGQWAASRLGKRAFIASSLYESGYDSSYAFQSGFETGGGTVIQSCVTQTSTKDELDKLMTSIQESNPDFVYAMYSGKAATAFVKAYANSGLKGQIPLAASPFTVDESLLPDMGKAANGIKSCFTWTAALDTPENSSFQKKFSLSTARNADIFAVLGYETAQMLTATVTNPPSNLSRTVHNASFQGPRGHFTMKAATGYSDTPLYLREVCQAGDSPFNKIIETLPVLSSWNKLEDRTAGSIKSGWTNTYLCT